MVSNMTNRITSVEVPIRTLREAHEATQKIIQEVEDLLGVAAIDVDDVYDNSELLDVFMVENPQRATSGGSHKHLPVARQFARMLVERLLYSDDVLLEWVGDTAPERLDAATKPVTL